MARVRIPEYIARKIILGWGPRNQHKGQHSGLSELGFAIRNMTEIAPMPINPTWGRAMGNEPVLELYAFVSKNYTIKFGRYYIGQMYLPHQHTMFPRDLCVGAEQIQNELDKYCIGVTLPTMENVSDSIRDNIALYPYWEREFQLNQEFINKMNGRS